MKHIVRLSVLATLVYVGIFLLSKDNVLHDLSSGGLSATYTFDLGMLLLIVAAIYAIILFDGWNRGYPDLGEPTKIDRFLTWLSDTEIDMRRSRARRRRSRQDRRDQRKAQQRAELGMGPAFK